MTNENDIILIYFEGKPSTFARVESISPDVKKDWFVIDLLLLQVPLQNVSWILKDIYINGESFTMDGQMIRLEKIINPQKKTNHGNEKDAVLNDKTGETKIISLSDRRKNK